MSEATVAAPKRAAKPAKPAAKKAATKAPAAKAPADGESRQLVPHDVWKDWPKQNVPLSAVKVGSRYRQSYRNIDKLAESIRRLGLLQPLVVDRNTMSLIAGGRRLKALEQLGLAEAPCVLIDPQQDKDADRLLTLLEMERDENEQREPFTYDERLNLARDLDKMLPKRAAPGERPRRERIAAAAQTSHETLRIMKEVQKAAKDDPKRFGDIEARLKDEKLTPTQAYRELQAARRAASDGAGHRLPERKAVAAVWEGSAAFDALRRMIRDAKKALSDLANGPGGELLAASGRLRAKAAGTSEGPETRWTHDGLDALYDLVGSCKPHSQCPACATEAGELGKYLKSCAVCHGHGYVPEAKFNEMVKADDKTVKALAKLAAAAEKSAK